MHFLSRLEQKVTITVSSRELPSEEIVIAASQSMGKEAPRAR